LNAPRSVATPICSEGSSPAWDKITCAATTNRPAARTASMRSAADSRASVITRCTRRLYPSATERYPAQGTGNSFP